MHKLKNSLIFILSALACFTFVSAVHPGLKSSLRSIFVPETKRILSTAKVDLLGDGKLLTLAKVKQGERLYIEVYELNFNGEQKLLHTIDLPDKNDGYFHFHGQATNLTAADVTGDGMAEIIAPSYDDNHQAHLNVYRYLPETKEFELMTQGPPLNY